MVSLAGLDLPVGALTAVYLLSHPPIRFALERYRADDRGRLGAVTHTNLYSAGQFVGGAALLAARIDGAPVEAGPLADAARGLMAPGALAALGGVSVVVVGVFGIHWKRVGQWIPTGDAGLRSPVACRAHLRRCATMLFRRMRCTPPSPSAVDLDALHADFAFTPDIDELATGLSLFGSPPRLRIVALLDRAGELCVCDLARVLDMQIPAVSQHLAKLRAHRLVKYRRDAQTLYYALSDHPLNTFVRAAITEAMAPGGE